MSAATVRLPVEPVIRVLGLVGEHLDGGDQLIAGARARAELAGITDRSLYRWRAKGGVPLDSADRVAVGLGFHPAQLWGRAYTDAVLELEWWAQVRADLARARRAACRLRSLARTRARYQPRDARGRFRARDERTGAR